LLSAISYLFLVCTRPYFYIRLIPRDLSRGSEVPSALSKRPERILFPRFQPGAYSRGIKLSFTSDYALWCVRPLSPSASCPAAAAEGLIDSTDTFSHPHKSLLLPKVRKVHSLHNAAYAAQAWIISFLKSPPLTSIHATARPGSGSGKDLSLSPLYLHLDIPSEWVAVCDTVVMTS